MAEEASFQIRIRAVEGRASRNLTVAELGVLLTGINRAINKAPGVDSIPRYSPRSQEPLGIRSEIIRVENGSILLTIVSSVVDFTQQNVIQATFLAGILGNAAWDFTKVLSKEIRRALGRIGNEVTEVAIRVEPFLEPDQKLDTIGNEVVPPASETSGPAQAVEAVKTPLPRAKTMYSFSFEQKGVTRIAMSFSATNRV